ncbi:Non-specific serine/threonine protein kinase [Bertholletia excelsa]
MAVPMEEHAQESAMVDEMGKQKVECHDDPLSPTGVLEVIGVGSDSDNSGSGSPTDVDKLSPIHRALFGDGALHWKNMIDNIKWKSVRRFSTIPMLAGDISKKHLKRMKLGRNRSADDEIDCGFVVPKPSWRNFTRAELAAATDNFSPERMVGKGGHAEVYKGILPDSKVVAIKRMLKTEKSDDDRAGDFLCELGIIAHINHPNAAKLVGFSCHGGLHLVFQFSPHGSLAKVLHGSTDCLDWKIRFKVALGVACGLHYLHCECPRRIIHRDITASNILLTEDYEPQISDFGLAKWLPANWSQHVVHPVEGTFGYMAPEYFMHGVVNEKTDIFALGVLILELITGRRAVDSSQQSLVIWAKPYLEQNKVKEIADPRMGDNYDSGEMKRAMVTALGCIDHLPSLRPTIARVVQLLRGEEAQWETKQKSIGVGGGAVILDACDLEGYTSATYLSDLDRHRQLVLE